MSARLEFIIGGVQKSGTTALHTYLSLHPQVLPATKKELHFFDNETLNWQEPDYSLLENAFDWSDAERKIAFDATPIYLFWPNALERIAGYRPDLKLIFIFRDPIERAWSHWRMETHRQAETMGFSQAIREGRDRLKHLPRNADAYRVYTYVERGFYDRQLERALSLFPRKNMLLLKSDQVRNQLRTTLDTISGFLGVEAFPRLETRDVFVGADRGETLDLSDIEYLRWLYFDEMIRFSRRSGLAIDDWLTMRTA